MSTIKLPKIIAIVGTTASGKTSLAVDLAYRFDGEIVSADSRQVYKYMDIGTGKDLCEYHYRIPQSKIRRNSTFDIRHSTFAKIPYHCIDLVHPNTEYSLGKWHRKATLAVDDILGRGKLPIIAGGTGLYAQALLEGFDLAETKPDWPLRERLEKLSVDKLYAKLKKLDRKFADALHASDRKNKRRLIRYIEIRSHIPSTRLRTDADRISRIENNSPKYETLILGITWPEDELKRRINERLEDRLKNEDMIGEVERLHKDFGVSWRRLIGFGLEYKYISLYLQGKLSLAEMKDELNRAVYQFSRRQLSWLRRWQRQGKKIYWIKNKNEAYVLLRKFIKKRAS